MERVRYVFVTLVGLAAAILNRRAAAKAHENRGVEPGSSWN